MVVQLATMGRLDDPGVATVAAVVAALAVAWVTAHVRRHLAGPHTWVRSWTVIGVGVVARGAAVAVAPDAPSLPAGLLGLLGSSLMVFGLVAAMRDRTTRGRAIDTAVEIALAAAAVAFTLAALATEEGAALTPEVTVNLAVPLVDVAVIWLLARVFEVVFESRTALLIGTVGAVAATGVDGLRAVDLLSDTLLGWSPSSAALLIGGVVAWGVALAHPSLRDPGPALPLTGFEFTTAHLATIVTPMLLGPISALNEFAHDRVRLWVIVGGAFALPLAVVVLLVRQVRLRARREYLAHHDPLTGLPNHRLFMDRVEIELSRQRRDGVGFAVMFLDLDRFKTVNDSLGHDVGDDLLRAVAERLVATVREGDSVARMGGDEFLILAPGVATRPEAHDLAVVLQQSLALPLTVDTRQLFTGASVGVALAPQHGTVADELVKHADTAMYRAKSSAHAGRVQLYTSEMNARSRLKLALENALRYAIEHDELALYFQPKVRAVDHVVVGHEALVRWQHPRLGLISPTGFVTLAEETGVIRELGAWILREACQQAGRWVAERRWSGPVSVNISPLQLVDLPLDSLVQRVLDETHVHPRLLEIELTESALLQDLEETATAIRRLRRRGVTVSLDDFGTGYSGLSYLARIPLDRLKIDRSFISTIGPDNEASPVVEAVLGMAEGLGLEVVAEGVETRFQADWLTARGCHTLQGFLFGAPEPADGVLPRVPPAVDPLRLNRVIAAVCCDEEAVDTADLEQALALLEQHRATTEEAVPRPTRRPALHAVARGVTATTGYLP